jgi:hypothetical protein
MFRLLIGACALVGMVLIVSACGCSGAKKEAKIPDTTIPVPKEGPMPAGAGGGKGAPQGGGAGAPEQTAQ